jgi:hypothetical protein
VKRLLYGTLDLISRMMMIILGLIWWICASAPCNWHWKLAPLKDVNIFWLYLYEAQTEPLQDGIERTG